MARGLLSMRLAMPRLLLASSSLLSLLLSACGIDEPPSVPATPPGDTPDDMPELARVEVHTSSEEVLFHGPDGALVARVVPTNGIAHATVPPGSTATAGRLVGRVTVGGRPQSWWEYSTATALADGDVIELGPSLAPSPDRPDVTVALPPAPADAPQLRVCACGGTETFVGATVTVDRRGCGERRGALFIAGDPAPRYALVATDLGAGPTLDLSHAAWLPLTGVPVRVVPGLSDDRIWKAGSAVLLDGELVPLLPPAAVHGVTKVPMWLGGPVPSAALASLGQSIAPTVSLLDEAVLAHASADPIEIDLSSPDFPELDAQRTGARSFSIAGDFDAYREGLTVNAFVGDDLHQTLWHVHLRGADLAIELPSEALPSGSLSRVELQGAGSAEHAALHRRLSFAL